MNESIDIDEDQDPLDSPDDFETDGKDGQEPEALPDDAGVDGND
ncbi:hypothetical protein [Stutzerimonas urumqiensis]